MLAIQYVDDIDERKLNVVRRRTKKNQIFLYDTKRRFDDFIAKIKFRLNGECPDVPHFIIKKDGEIFQIFNPHYSSQTFNNPDIDKRLIKVAVENLGWLTKNTITGVLHNWIDDPYRSDPYIKHWRSHYYWDPYTVDQIKSISSLSAFLCEEHNIPKEVVPSQGYLKNAPKFKGVTCKSNYSNIYTDINPSFNFNSVFNYAKETDIT